MTKLGAEKDEASISRRSAILSSVFRSGVSMRSFANMPTLSGPQPHPNRVELTEKEKAVVFSRDLKVSDPQAPHSLVRLKYSQNVYEEVPGVEESIIVNCEQVGRITPVSEIKLEAHEEIGEEEEEGAEKEEKILRNQFNFSDRATQGRIMIYLDQGTLTEAPLPKDCTGSANQREIAAAYARDRKSALLPKANSASSVTRIMERVVNQNMDPNACCDFKYFDDQRDTLTREAAYTLPLWEFKSDSVGTCGVSMLQWNPKIMDLFAAAYAPVTTVRDKGVAQRGFVCTWSLKNQSNARTVIELSGPATSIAWNPNQPYLLAAGAGDGNITIFDVRSSNTQPVFNTYRLMDRHATNVTVLKWQPPDSSGNQTLLSAGLDGRILMWTLIQNEMKMTEITQLPSGVVALDYFNEHATHFKVACDDGKIYNVLRTRTTQIPTSFEAHSPPVMALCFNKFHSSVYASCGTDWAVKIWRDGEDFPLQSYDYAPHYVTDCQFAPHSSTVIGTVTSDGELFIYDIAVNRYKEICKTDVVEAGDGGLTSLRFHPKWPMVIVGDEKGRIHAMKLSPNLRRNTKTEKEEAERQRMTKSASSRDSRGLLPDLTQQPDEDDDGANAAAEEEARNEALAHDEAVKFVKSMGVSWINYPEVIPALPPA